MLRNQALAFHRVSERCYDLTGLRTGSVRDQMLRAILLTEGLLDDSKEIDDGPAGGLLVLGGGVAGVACALVASQRGIAVTLIERDIRELGTLTRADTRRIAPYEYDWPRPKPANLRFPNDVSGVTLDYTTGIASNIALAWQAVFIRYLQSQTPPRVEAIYRSNARKYTYDEVKNIDEVVTAILVGGVWAPSERPKYRAFGAVVVCTGSVWERVYFVQRGPSQIRSGTKLKTYAGPGFWTNSDCLDEPSFGSPPRAIDSILVSGGGDGGMQDFQRAATGMFGEALYDHLVKSLNDPCYAVDAFSLLVAEDKARRAYAWKMSNPKGGALLKEMAEWDKAFVDEVDRLLDLYVAAYVDANKQGSYIPSRNEALTHLGKKVLRSDTIGNKPPRVIWTVRESHPGYAYALNRFLAHVVAKLLEPFQGEPVIRLSTQITEIVPDDPTWDCCPDFTKCQGKTHWVTFSGSDVPEPYQIIIIRHGLKFPSRPYLKHPSPVPEQLVPYEIPR